MGPTFPTNYSTEFQNLLDAANKKDTNGGGRGEGSCRGRNSTKLFRLEWRAPFRTLIVDGSTFNWTSEKRLRLVGRASPRPTVICLLLHRSVPRTSTFPSFHDRRSITKPFDLCYRFRGRGRKGRRKIRSQELRIFRPRVCSRLSICIDRSVSSSSFLV